MHWPIFRSRHVSRVPTVLVVLASLSPMAATQLRAQVSVTPDGTASPSRNVHTTGWKASFTVFNNGGFGSVNTFKCAAASVVVCDSIKGPATIGPGANANVDVYYSTTNQGTGTITLRASGIPGTDDGFYSVPVVVPAGAPRINAAPFLADNQNVALCAHACFNATHTQRTVPYLSLDQSRAVSLVYRGDRVAPRPFVLVNVAPDSTFGTWPSEYQLQVKVNGSLVTFVNGETTLRFSNPSNLTYRIGGQFDASAYADSVAYPLEIIVTSKIGMTTYTNRWVTQYLSINEAANPVARGWTVAGVQRAFVQSDSSVLIKEGNGAATYFKKQIVFGVQVWATPAGDFSTLAKVGSHFVRSYPDSTKVTFANGRLMAQRKDRWGVRDTIQYDGSNRITHVKDHLNNAIVFAYGANGLASITDPMGRVTNVTVDGSKRLMAIKDPDGDSTRFGYDANLRLQRVVNRRNDSTMFSYLVSSGVETNKLSALTAPPVAVFGAGTQSPATSLSPWDTVAVPYVATAVTPKTPVQADVVYGRVIEPGGALTRFSVDRWGQPVRTIKALADTTTVAYSSDGKPVRVRLPHYGASVYDTMAYNAAGMMVYRRNADLSTSTIVYGAFSQATGLSGTGGAAVDRYIGANGRLDSIRVNGVKYRSFTYNTADGRVATVRDAAGTIVLSNTYPGSGSLRNMSRQDAGNGSRILTYDSYGRIVTDSMSGQLKVTHRYDVVNRVIADSVNDPVHGAVKITYAYNKVGLDTAITDPKGAVYRYGYNSLGWLTRKTDPAGRDDSLFYSVDGDLRRFKSRRLQTVDLAYDSLHRVTARGTATFTYANRGTVLTASGGPSVETSYLAVNGQPDSVKTVLNGQTFWRRYSYNSYRNMTGITVSGGGITWASRGYTWNDARGSLASITFNGRTTTIGNNANMLDTLMLFPGGGGNNNQKVVYGTLQTALKYTTDGGYAGDVERYVGLDLLGRTANQLGQGALSGHFYSYNLLGQLATVVKKTNTANPPTCTEVIAGAQNCFPAPTWTTDSTYSYSFDKVGNRTDNGGTYAAGNRITAFGGCTYQTDFDGNVVGRKGTAPCVQIDTLLWTADGRLDSVKVGATGVKFLYDAAGRVVQKRVGGVTQAWFIWNGDDLLAELGSGATTKTAEYSYYGTDQLHGIVVGTKEYFAFTDRLGSPVALVDTGKVVARKYAFDEWGKLTGGGDFASFNNADRARWKGTLWIGGPEVDIYYMRHRWYETGSGRFLSEDPVGVVVGLNNVAYAAADPVNGSDPQGLCDEVVKVFADGSVYCRNKDGTTEVVFGYERQAEWLKRITTLWQQWESASRPMTLGEQYRYGPICATMDCNKVRILEKAQLIDDRAFTGCNTIAFPGNAGDDPATFAHELYHASQCQAKGPVIYFFNTGTEQLMYSVGLDVYRWEKYGRRAYESEAQAASDCFANFSAAACRLVPVFPRP